MNSAIIVAAGNGRRMNSEQSKQFISIAGVPILVRTLTAFEKTTKIDNIIIVTRKCDIEAVKQLISEYNIKKVIAVIEGGNTRQMSVLNGIKSIRQFCPSVNNVLIHDGARPFISEKSIVAVLEALKSNKAAAVGVPIKDTIKQVSPDGFIEKTLDRDTLISIQTPQGFDIDLIFDAHNKAIENNINVTDDCSLVELLTDVPIKIIIGDYNNIKITTPEDLSLGENIISILSSHKNNG